MQRYIRTNSVGAWTRSFIDMIRRPARPAAEAFPRRLDEHVDQMLADCERAPHRTLLINYEDALRSVFSAGSTPVPPDDALESLRGLHKVLLLPRIRERWRDGEFILAIGSDRTDEDLFVQLPSSARTCRLGRHATRARYFVDSWPDVVRLLRRILEHLAHESVK